MNFIGSLRSSTPACAEPPSMANTPINMTYTAGPSDIQDRWLVRLARITSPRRFATDLPSFDGSVHRRQARVQRFENMGREDTGAQHCQKRYQHLDRAFI
ncbi:hypothetical protein [Bradyrhizobium iriomotense]|uniref:hypothetical protein n=1 Tax=Bradyrhizobium iriomotense TaxID=441950 RepID=UPI0024E108D6|nr:hypothetical protein [Bradyrhizobium iriomotense]